MKEAAENAKKFEKEKDLSKGEGLVPNCWRTCNIRGGCEKVVEYFSKCEKLSNGEATLS
jgi:hypothetical protein